MWLNDPELAHNHPIPFVTPAEVLFGKVQCCHTSLNSCNEPSPTAPPPGEQGVSGGCALVRGGLTASNHVP